MPNARARRSWLLLMPLMICGVTTAHALEARVGEIRITGQTVIASVDLREFLPEKLAQVLQSGGPLYLRVQAELWEDRPVWDRLVRPALLSVFRIVRDPATSRIAISDAVGEIMSFTQIPDPLSLRVNAAPAEAIADEAKYYLRIVATLGTLAEREVEEAGAAVFGQNRGVGLGALGRFIFTTVVQAGDYLQSVSTEARTASFRRRDILPR